MGRAGRQAKQHHAGWSGGKWLFLGAGSGAPARKRLHGVCGLGKSRMYCRRCCPPLLLEIPLEVPDTAPRHIRGSAQHTPAEQCKKGSPTLPVMVLSSSLTDRRTRVAAWSDAQRGRHGQKCFQATWAGGMGGQRGLPTVLLRSSPRARRDKTALPPAAPAALHSHARGPAPLCPPAPARPTRPLPRPTHPPTRVSATVQAA